MKPQLKVVPYTGKEERPRRCRLPPVVIEDGIPYPQKQHASRYRWDELKIGQSFGVPKDVNIEGFSCVINQAQRALPGRKFSYRRVFEEEFEYRCWRIA